MSGARIAPRSQPGEDAAAGIPAPDERAITQLLDEAELQTRTNPVRALELAERAWRASDDIGDGAFRAICLRAMGHAHFELGHHTQSLDLYDEAAQLFSAAGKPTEAARTHLSTIHSLMYLGRTGDALALGRRLRRIFARHRETLNLARLEANLSVIHARLHRPRRALALADTAAARFAALGDDLMLAQQHANRANILTHVGGFREALGAYMAARAAFAARDMRAWAATIDVNIGSLYAAQGHYNQALQALTAACRVFADLSSHKDLAQARLDLAGVYLALNLQSEAATLAAQAADTFAGEGMRHDMARALLVQAQALAAGNSEDEALALLEQAEAAVAAESFTVGMAIVKIRRAALLMASDPAHALRQVMEAEPVLARAGLVGPRGQCLLLKAAAHEQLGARRIAFAALDSAQRLGVRYELPWLLAEAHRGQGRLHERSDRARARRAYEDAIEALESMRAELRHDELRISFLRSRLGPYEDLLRLLLRDGDANQQRETFALVERMRSRALLDMLGGNLDMTAGDTSTEPEQVQVDTELERLREELNWQHSAIHGWPGESASRHSKLARRQALRSARVLEEEFNGLMRQRRLLRSRDTTVQNGSAVDLAMLQSHLATDQALIEYAIIDDEVLAFVVSQDSISLVRRLCSATEVGYLIDRLHAGLQRFSYGEDWTTRFGAEQQQTTDRHLARLGEALLAPLRSALNSHDRLVIAPHGPLHYVPFHALQGPSGVLLDTHETVIAPSAGVWATCKERAHSVSTPPAAALILGVDDDQAKWMLHEARTIGRLFPGARVRLGAEASVETIVRDGPACDLLHLACHGVFRSDAPLFSALRLSDGWLTVHDIDSLRFRAQLVTLSGCQTGRQSIGPGDDLIGLARGFFLAGAQQLLVSHWMVNDASTGLFMEHFYEMYCRGLSAPAALRLAQRALREQFPYPYHWAPFAVIGAG